MVLVLVRCLCLTLAILLILACDLELFPLSTIREVLARKTKQAVLVSATQNNDIDVTSPAKELTLDPKLQQMCTAVGLLGRNTIYGFRRTAIIKVRRATDSEFTRQVAGHRPNTDSIVPYDTEDTADVDITALRPG